MKFKITEETIEPGQYEALFEELKEYEGDWGPQYIWCFRIVGGKYAGKEISRFSKQEPVPKSTCLKMLTGLIGHPPKVGEEIEMDDYVGKRVNIYVDWNEGQTRTQVDKIMGLVNPAEAPAPRVSSSTPSAPPPPQPRTTPSRGYYQGRESYGEEDIPF